MSHGEDADNDIHEPTADFRIPASEALATARQFLAGEIGVAELCNYAADVIARYDEHYPADDDTDFASHMTWIFSAQLDGYCSQMKIEERQGDEGRIRTSVEIWLPHLESGDEVWIAMVERGEWAFNWEDE